MLAIYIYLKKKEKKKDSLLFSCLTKLCQLLCLKYCGKTVFENAVGFDTLKRSPWLDQAIKSDVSGSSSILFSRVSRHFFLLFS
jgi:hypothetical protein